MGTNVSGRGAEHRPPVQLVPGRGAPAHARARAWAPRVPVGRRAPVGSSRPAGRDPAPRAPGVDPAGVLSVRSGGQDRPGVVDVAVHLGHQGVDRVEARSPRRRATKRDPGPLRRRGRRRSRAGRPRGPAASARLVEGRAPAERDGRGVHRARRGARTSRRRSLRRAGRSRRGTATLAVGKPSSAAAPAVAVDDRHPAPGGDGRGARPPPTTSPAATSCADAGGRHGARRRAGSRTTPSTSKPSSAPSRGSRATLPLRP